MYDLKFYIFRNYNQDNNNKQTYSINKVLIIIKKNKSSKFVLPMLSI